MPGQFPPDESPFKGLPNDRCQCDHWGYVFKGAFRVTYLDGDEEIITAGQAYHLRPGHFVQTLEPVELLEGWLVQKMTKYRPHTLTTGLVRQALERLLSDEWYVDSQEPIAQDRVGKGDGKKDCPEPRELRADDRRETGERRQKRQRRQRQDGHGQAENDRAVRCRVRQVSLLPYFVPPWRSRPSDSSS